MNNEVWKPVKDYEGYYEVSNYGNVRSLDRVVNTKGRKYGPNKKTVKGRMLKLHLEKPTGYYTVTLCKDGEEHTTRVHTIVLKSFIGERPIKQVSRHLTQDKTNNNIHDLSYGTYFDNNVVDRINQGTYWPKTKDGILKNIENAALLEQNYKSSMLRGTNG